MKRIPSLLFALLLIFSLLLSSAYAEKSQPQTEENESEEEQTAEEKPKPQKPFTINSEEDFLLFASECGMDSWSANRCVFLFADLDFTGMEFSSVPIFCGSFYGCGHSISGVNITSEGSHTGVFRYVSESGSIRSLNISGTVTPGGTGISVGGIVGSNSGLVEKCSFSGTVSGIEQVGGIAGENCENGKLVSCSFSGTITGEHMVGGVAGTNKGEISACSNSGAVNNVRISVSDAITFDVSEITSSFSSEDFLNITDIGGVCGHNSGSILNCDNSGPIGYNRMGYNVGGIAGRSEGCIASCRNNGVIKGRKDVGGIAGQLEPYTFWSFSKSKLEEIDEQIKLLDKLTDESLKESDGYNRQIKSTLSEFSSDLKTAMAELEPILSSVSNSANEVNSALEQIQAISSSEESGNPTPADISEIIGEMTGETQPDKLNQISEIVSGVELETPDFNPLITSLNAAADSGSRLSAILGSYAGELTDNVRILVEQANNVYAGFTDTAEYLKNLDGEYTSDISADAIDEYARGTVGSCVNSSPVSAETNTGGIVGAAAVEFSFDVEDELNISDYLFTDPSYMIYAVIRNCESYSDVSAVKSCAGGTAGRMDFGAAGFCTAAGDIKVSSGDFCGGIVGKSTGTVISCCSRVQLSGSRYVGGIAGQGNNLENCRAYAYVDSADEYFGTVAGSVSGECAGNFFVKNGTNAIDDISYCGVAEPLEYSEMVRLDDIPDLFKDISVSFYVDDVCFKNVTVPFGGSISTLPKVPDSDGMYWKWDDFDAEHIYYSLTVNGKYCKPITTLTSREDPPLFLVQGNFFEGQQLEVIPFSPDKNKLDVTDEMILSSHTLKVNECEGVLTFRMRSENDGRLYILNQDGNYSKLDYVRDGSYIIFDAANGSSLVYVSAKSPVTQVAVVIAAASVAGVTMAVLLTLRKKKRIKNTIN